MTTTLSPRTVQQRAAEATGRLRRTLEVDDLKLLSAAVAEVAADTAERDPRFAQRIRETYQDLYALRATRPVRRTGSEVKDVALVPIGSMGDVRIDPYAPLDAYTLHQLYGSSQLRSALSVYSLPKLKQALAPVEQRHPGTKPTSRAEKDSIIDYIVEHVAGPGY